MPVQNRIVKVQKRNRALVRFDSSRIGKAMLRAAESIGGFHQDFLPGVNDRIFSAHGSDERHRRRFWRTRPSSASIPTRTI